jgi:hypothetical protein
MRSSPSHPDPVLARVEGPNAGGEIHEVTRLGSSFWWSRWFMAFSWLEHGFGAA